MTDHRITSEADLLALYETPRPTSLTKEIDYISEEYAAFIAASPFMAMATAGPGGVDCSPRGDHGNVVDVVDPHTIRFADRRGNNRLDSLRNLVHDPRISLLFLIPGITETMRVVGSACISTAPELLAHYTVDGSVPRTVIEISVERAYFQCSRATMRSGLWEPARQVDRASLPTCGEMLERISDGDIVAADYDPDLQRRLGESLY